MATRIEAVSLVTGGPLRRRSALRLAVAAGRDSISRAGLAPSDIDLLINVGVYRDGNLGEPALAPLIQEDLGANSEDPHPGGAGTFSFDISNGSCGVLTALQVADGFLRSGTVGTVLVVASDADPGRGMAPGFPFSPSGGALLCRWVAGRPGLVGMGWHSHPDGGKSFRSTVEFKGDSNRLAVEEDPLFARRGAEEAAEAAAALLLQHGLVPADVDVVVAGPDRPGLAQTLGDRLGLPGSRIVTDGARLHTTALVAALRRAESDGRLSAGATCLLACGGAGVIGGAALYRT